MPTGCYGKTTALMIASAILFCAFPARAEESHVRERSESVYVDLETDGTPKSVISSVYLVNSDGAAQLSDNTTLTDIKNVLSNEKPEIDGQRITFQADGEDVCYQGTGQDELPVSLKINYTLDGKQISGEELSGKSGYLDINIKSYNHSSHTRLIDGEELTLFTPFSVICILTLNDGFSMIQCDHGRVSSQAGNTSVLSMLYPGLKSSLGLESAEDINDELTLCAQVKDFSLDSMMFVVMTGLVDEDNLTAIDDIQELLDGIDEMADATDELYDGAEELDDGAADYVEGLREFGDGMQEFRDGLEKFNGGITEYFFGVKELGSAAGKLASGAWSLNGGAVEMENGIKQAMTDSSGAMLFAAGIVDQLRPYISSEPVLDALRDQIFAYYKNANTVQMAELLKGVSQLASGSAELASGLSEFSGGATKVSNGGLDLLSAAGDLRDGFLDLQEGAKELSDGAEDIHEGTGEFKDGIEEFRDEGIKQMQKQTHDIAVAISRKSDILALSEEYRSFSCTEKDIGGSVQFIMNTEEIISAKPIPELAEKQGGLNEVEVIQETEPSWFARLWNTIKSWFSK